MEASSFCKNPLEALAVVVVVLSTGSQHSKIPTALVVQVRMQSDLALLVRKPLLLKVKSVPAIMVNAIFKL